MAVMPWPPVRSAFADPLVPTQVSRDWLDWFQAMADRTSRTPERLLRLSRAGLSAPISQTQLPLTALPAGLLRISTYVRITQPAGTSSSLQVTLFWADGGIALSQAGALLTTNTVQTFEARSIMVRRDANSPIQYQVAYTSSGNPAMTYKLDIVVEGLF